MSVTSLLLALLVQISPEGSPADFPNGPTSVDRASATSADQISSRTQQTVEADGEAQPSLESRRKALTPEQLQDPRVNQLTLDQAGPKVRGTSTEQLAKRDPTAAAPTNLSSVPEGRSVAVIVVQGKDRCEPIKGIATREECADILDNRAEQFAHAVPPEPSAEDQAIALPPSVNPAANAATAARRLAGPEGSSPAAVQDAINTEATSEGVQQATLAGGFGDRAPPAVPAGVASVFNSAAAGSAATTPSGIVITTTPAPK